MGKTLPYARVSPIKQKIKIQGNSGIQTDLELVCTGVTTNLDGSGSTAQFENKHIAFDEDAVARYRNKNVMVWINEHGSNAYNSKPVFRGYIQNVSASADGTNNAGITISAVSVVPMLAHVPVGLGLGQLVQPYYARLGWTPPLILKSIFDSLPGQWRNAVRLGNMDVFNNYASALVPRDFEFRATSVLDAMEQLLEPYGMITYCERFDGNFTWLDFIDKTVGTTPTSASLGAGCYGTFIGENVSALAMDESTTGQINRVVGCGARSEVVATFSNRSASPHTKLLPNWVNYRLTLEIATAEGVVADVTKTCEEWVLSNPDYASDSSDDGKAIVKGVTLLDGTPVPFDPLAIAHDYLKNVFKVYNLPTYTRQLRGIGEDLPITKLDLNYPQGDAAAYPQFAFTDVKDVTSNHSLQVIKQAVKWAPYDPELIGEVLIAQGRLFQNEGSYSYEQWQANEKTLGYGCWQPDPNSDDGWWKLFDWGALADIATYDGYELVTGFEFDAKARQLKFSDPAVEPIFEYQSPSSGSEEYVKTYAEQIIYLTCSLILNDYLQYDTGAINQREALAVLGQAGVCDMFQMDDFKLAKLGNASPAYFMPDATPRYLPIFDLVGNPVLINKVLYYNENVKAFVEFEDDGQQMATSNLRSDYQKLKWYTEAYLKERSRTIREYQVTIGFITQAYKLGERLRIQNLTNYVDDNYVIENISYSFGEAPTVTLRASNSKQGYVVEIDDYDKMDRR